MSLGLRNRPQMLNFNHYLGSLHILMFYFVCFFFQIYHDHVIDPPLQIIVGYTALYLRNKPREAVVLLD